MRQDAREAAGEATACWPPVREQLQLVTIELLSLHHLPKRGERRQGLDGRRAACHKHVPELTGASVPPTDAEVSEPSVSVSLHAIGGFCAVCGSLPLPPLPSSEFRTPWAESDGFAARLGHTVHCVAAEPHATFLRVAVFDGEQEVAYETAVLGRLKGGYRVLLLRGQLGTRIELCQLFVRISFGAVAHEWQTQRELRMQAHSLKAQLALARVSSFHRQSSAEG